MRGHGFVTRMDMPVDFLALLEAELPEESQDDPGSRIANGPQPNGDLEVEVARPEAAVAENCASASQQSAVVSVGRDALQRRTPYVSMAGKLGKGRHGTPAERKLLTYHMRALA